LNLTKSIDLIKKLSFCAILNIQFLESDCTLLGFLYFDFSSSNPVRGHRFSKQMQTATNAILTGLAVADLLVMVSYAPYAFHTFVRPSRDERVRFSYPWTLYTLLHANSSVVLHTVSIWLTVLLAVFRYNALRSGLCSTKPHCKD
jgi:hypothetical protein